MSLKPTLRPDWRQAAEPRIALVSIPVLMAWLRQSDIVTQPVRVMPANAERLRFDQPATPPHAPAAPTLPQIASVPPPPPQQDRWAMSRDFSLPIKAVAVRRPNFTVSPELLAADARQERWQYQITRPMPAPPPPLVAPPQPPPAPASLPAPALPPSRVLPVYAGEAFQDDVYDDLFDPPVPKPEPVRLLSLIDRLPDRLTGAERAQHPASAPFGRMLAFMLVAALFLGTLGYVWLR